MGSLMQCGLSRSLAPGVNPLDPRGEGTPPTFVYSANLAGEMLGSTARTARAFYQASYTGRGFTGNSYALPAGPRYGQRFIHTRLAQEYKQFFADAAGSPRNTFLLPQIGCNARHEETVGNGMAVNEDLIKNLAISKAPDNVMLPGAWERARNRDKICRLSFYGQAYLNDAEVFSALDYLMAPCFDEVPRENIEILLLPREDSSSRSIKYARSRGLKTRPIVPLQDGLLNDDVRTTHLVYWWATHCILLYSSDEKYQRFHKLDRYGDLSQFFQLALNHRLITRRADIERIRPVFGWR